MIRKLILGIIIVAIAGTITITASARGGNGTDPGFSINIIKTKFQNIPKEKLSEKEIKGIIRMREEEKLARDVYRKLSTMWNLRIFSNITKSEQVHLDAVKLLIDRYNLEDPVKSDEIGVFSSEEFEKLYKKLIDKGSKSVVDALQVGMMIEDIDIYDLQEALKESDNKDIKFVYDLLLLGSRNHMRAFYRNLKKSGGDYSPKYISKEEFKKIISSPMERGMH